MSGPREYVVVLTVREHWSVTVVASSAAEARSQALLGHYVPGSEAMHNDREWIAARALKADES